MYKRIVFWIIITVTAVVTLPLQAQRIAAGDKFPVILTDTLSGGQYERQPGSNRALLVAFLSSGQKQSQQAADDIQRLADSFIEYRGQLDIVIVMDDPSAKSLFKETEGSDDPICLVHDVDRKLWGQFHIVAAPTVIIVDKSDKVSSVIAGHGYDFMPSVKFQLNQALGIEQQMTAEQVGEVRTVQNNTTSARLQRHLKMAKMLEQRGKIDAAAQQLKQARQMDPNDVQVVFELGKLYCRQNQPDLAVKVLEGASFETKSQEADAELINGWANRLLGNTDRAMKHLVKATELNPRSAVAFFELGQAYEASAQVDLALQAYKQALTLLIKTR